MPSSFNVTANGVYPIYSLFVDPLFWQALCKENLFGNLKIFINTWRRDGPRTLPAWHYQMHRFIDHLAEGKDADSFFDTLLHHGLQDK